MAKTAESGCHESPDMPLVLQQQVDIFDPMMVGVVKPLG